MRGAGSVGVGTRRLGVDKTRRGVDVGGKGCWVMRGGFRGQVGGVERD